ncbi:MAG: hypothetical protein JXR66_07920, partial [Bacteroidales bacterium]|nr:hypothetical protein [Bacteroidales bacterium]
MKNDLIFFPGLFICLLAVSCTQKQMEPIDRLAVVNRHNITNTTADSLNSLSLGNGEFAFTADITGLQTFPGVYARGIPLGTMSNWGWHSEKNPGNYNLTDVYRTYDVHGRNVDYVHQFRAGDMPRRGPATEWLRANPHKIHLGLAGLHLKRKDGKDASVNDIKGIEQTLNIASGILESSFVFEETPVRVTTVCHPEKDMISARIESGLIPEGRLGLKLTFWPGLPLWAGFGPGDPEKHETRIVWQKPGQTLFERQQDEDKYYVLLLHPNAAVKESEPHLYIAEPDKNSNVFEFSCLFSKTMTDYEPEAFPIVVEASLKSWEAFWLGGGAVDFSECTDPRASELERRVILSRYLTKIQCSGSLPPAETGLT